MSSETVLSHNVYNENMIPQTIEELQEWYDNHDLPSSDITRFYIGYDYQGSCAYGIYKKQSDNTFVVYKNKPDGTRVIRYSGDSEALAVNELFKKLIVELKKQSQIKKAIEDEERETKQRLLANKQMYRNKYNFHQDTGLLMFVAIIVVLVITTVFSIYSSRAKRYRVDNYYYEVIQQKIDNQNKVSE